MAATESLCKIIGLNTDKLSRQENVIIEGELFIHVYSELKKIFREQHKHYFRMLEANLLRYIIHDIVSTEEYSLSGIACYTNTSEDLICDIVVGQNNSPSLPLSRKIIELHRSVRPVLYREMMKRITEKLLASTQGDPMSL